MTQIVTNVREIRAVRSQTRRDLYRLREGEMGGVWLVAQRIEHEDAHALEECPRRVRNRAAVSEICECAEPESENSPPAVQNRHRHNFHATERERPHQTEQLELRNAAMTLRTHAAQYIGQDLANAATIGTITV